MQSKTASDSLLRQLLERPEWRPFKRMRGRLMTKQEVEYLQAQGDLGPVRKVPAGPGRPGGYVRLDA